MHVQAHEVEEGEQDEAGGRRGRGRARHLARARHPMIRRGKLVLGQHLWLARRVIHPEGGNDPWSAVQSRRGYPDKLRTISEELLRALA